MQERRDHEGDGYGGEDGQPAGVGEGLLVEAPGVGLVGPADLKSEYPQTGHEAPRRQPRDDEGEDHHDPARPTWVGDAQRVEEVDYVMLARGRTARFLRRS